jgi:hypothetical protein
LEFLLDPGLHLASCRAGPIEEHIIPVATQEHEDDGGPKISLKRLGQDLDVHHSTKYVSSAGAQSAFPHFPEPRPDISSQQTSKEKVLDSLWLLIAKRAGCSLQEAMQRRFFGTSHAKNLQLYGALERQICVTVGSSTFPAKKAEYADLAENTRG